MATVLQTADGEGKDRRVKQEIRDPRGREKEKGIGTREEAEEANEDAGQIDDVTVGNVNEDHGGCQNQKDGMHVGKCDACRQGGGILLHTQKVGGEALGVGKKMREVADGGGDILHRTGHLLEVQEGGGARHMHKVEFVIPGKPERGREDEGKRRARN